jgi:hypothetical protein
MYQKPKGNKIPKKVSKKFGGTKGKTLRRLLQNQRNQAVSATTSVAVNTPPKEVATQDFFAPFQMTEAMPFAEAVPGKTGSHPQKS